MKKAISVLLLSSALTSCTTTPNETAVTQQGVTESPSPDAAAATAGGQTGQAQLGVNDPLEPLNRGLFFINRFLDGALLKPTAIIYKTIIPLPMRDSVSNFLDYTLTPIFFGNHILQAQPVRAINTAMRFVLNSTLGICGLFDIAKDLGLPPEPTWFGETLATWGIDMGPYVMLPFFGPSTFRETVGMAGDWYMDPLAYYYTSDGRDHKWLLDVRTGARALRDRAAIIDEQGNDGLEALEKSSADYYAAVRSVYLQRLAYREQQLYAQRGLIFPKEVNVEVGEAEGLPRAVHPVPHDGQGVPTKQPQNSK